MLDTIEQRPVKNVHWYEKNLVEKTSQAVYIYISSQKTVINLTIKKVWKNLSKIFVKFMFAFLK